MSRYWNRLDEAEWDEFVSDVGDLLNAHVDFVEMYYQLREEGWDWIDFDDLRESIEEAYGEDA